MSDWHRIISDAYAAFNERRLEDVLALMQPDVEWPNGMEGGTVHGHAGVRAYWLRQWAVLDPRVEPVRVDVGPNGEIVVDVHQVVRDRDGNVLVDHEVRHVYTFVGGRIQRMEIR